MLGYVTEFSYFGDGVKQRGVTACSSGDWVDRFII